MTEVIVEQFRLHRDNYRACWWTHMNFMVFPWHQGGSSEYLTSARLCHWPRENCSLLGNISGGWKSCRKAKADISLSIFRLLESLQQDLSGRSKLLLWNLMNSAMKRGRLTRKWRRM